MSVSNGFEPAHQHLAAAHVIGHEIGETETAALRTIT